MYQLYGCAEGVDGPRRLRLCRELLRRALGAQFRSRRTQTPCIPLRRPSPPQFERPAFNEERDPGPPTADIFEPAPKKPTLFSDLPTPEPAGEVFKTIGTIKVSSEYGYYVYSLVVEGNLVP